MERLKQEIEQSIKLSPEKLDTVSGQLIDKLEERFGLKEREARGSIGYIFPETDQNGDTINWMMTLNKDNFEINRNTKNVSEELVVIRGDGKPDSRSSIKHTLGIKTEAGVEIKNILEDDGFAKMNADRLVNAIPAEKMSFSDHP